MFVCRKSKKEEMRLDIVVLVKQTFDTEAKIAISGGKIDDTGVTLIMNPFDEFAVEEAVRIKEKLGGEVVAVSLGGPKAQNVLRYALAMGADRAVLLDDDLFKGDEVTVAAALAKLIESRHFDLILAGNIAIDDQSAQVPSRVAVNLNVPVVTSVVKLDLDGDKAICQREIEGGVEVVEVTLPAVITAKKGINEPRYPSMSNIMKSKEKELKVVKADDIGFTNVEALTETIAITLPPVRSAGKIISGEAAEAAKELVRLLKNEAKVI
jgi:electron transfer flavoprotein beta subunit